MIDIISKTRHILFETHKEYFVHIGYSHPELTEEELIYKNMPLEEMAQKFMEEFELKEGDTLFVSKGYRLASYGAVYLIVRTCDPYKETFKLSPICINFCES